MELLSGSLLYAVTKDLARLGNKYLKTDQKRSITSLEQHITWCEGWCRHIQMFGMTKPLSIERESISLSITNRPRKFYSPDLPMTDRKLHTEQSIISDPENYLILGDPGCGKTTLFKRITRHLILDEPASENDIVEAPLVVLGRDLDEANTVFRQLCTIFGVEIRPFDAAFHAEELEAINDPDKRRERRRSLQKVWKKNSNNASRSIILELLSANRLALLIDGIDEINSDYRSDFERDLDDIINTCPQLKVLCTCRMGDWTRSSTSLNILAIEALSDDELSEIIKLWADKPEQFQKEIDTVPYREVLDRPLFLTLLIIIFNQGYKLPDCPVDVYERIIWVLIDRWDKERDIHRESRFSSFLSEKKIRFLSAIAFELTFTHQIKRFKTKSLETIYKSLCQRFNLPPNEFREVLTEIESHTGILVESGFDHFEFCHLTVQEFLAAKHLVGLVQAPDFLKLLELSPATLAVATSLAAEPSSYLASVLDRFSDEQKRLIGINQASHFEMIIPYVARLKLEIPEFSISNSLAIAVMKLWAATSLYRNIKQVSNFDEVYGAVLELTTLPIARESALMLLNRTGVQVAVSRAGTSTVLTMGKQFSFDTEFLEYVGFAKRGR